MNELILGLIIIALIIYIIYSKSESFLERQMTGDMQTRMSSENFLGSSMGEDMSRGMAGSKDKWEGSMQENFESFDDYKGDGYDDILDGDSSYVDYMKGTLDPSIIQRHRDNFVGSMKDNDPSRISAVTSVTRYTTRETPPPPGKYVGFSIPRAQKIDYSQRQIPEIVEESYAQEDAIKFNLGY